MADKLLNALKQRLTSLELVPFNDGRFEVFKDGEKLYSKLDTAQFPDEDKVVKRTSQR